MTLTVFQLPSGSALENRLDLLRAGGRFGLEVLLVHHVAIVVSRTCFATGFTSGAIVSIRWQQQFLSTPRGASLPGRGAVFPIHP
jgi:hypothetical protein